MIRLVMDLPVAGSTLCNDPGTSASAGTGVSLEVRDYLVPWDSSRI